MACPTRELPHTFVEEQKELLFKEPCYIPPSRIHSRRGGGSTAGGSTPGAAASRQSQRSDQKPSLVRPDQIPAPAANAQTRARANALIALAEDRRRDRLHRIA